MALLLAIPFQVGQVMLGPDLAGSVLGSFLGLLSDAWIGYAVVVVLLWSEEDWREEREGWLRSAIVGPITKLLPLVLLFLLVEVGVGLGLGLLILPGVYLFSRWLVALPVMVVEGWGVRASLSASSSLTKEHGRWLFTLSALLLLLLAVPGALTFGLGATVWSQVVALAGSALVFPFVVTVMVETFLRLGDRTDEPLGAILDR
ncbi:MAG: glycerophosphoryl diester phosphodiesterase membrane domain-containing protein [Solirubrobacterales bacterium]|nr:glycerophosphoryl diester phosphodiesterase membrane domain-containing protein [Solirubrobacterales bacterium]